ncbi:MAG: PstS family phosphate ABC transporter substrate-binding protein [Solirubrobacterales bacterium]|nr:PstS family phosphate ABC transporter substrate-binding protein [Solirubrobacterales bacterium]OJU93940.1 MAG: phosphate ABC transporter substrate-binding protein [Solirubrobacterales bacterium 67-14]
MSKIAHLFKGDLVFRSKHKFLATLALVGALALGVAACGSDDDSSDASTSGSSGGDLSGTIKIDGSSTVGPLSEPIAELFQQDNPGVKVTVGTSGTGGGFEKFCAGETQISDASRPIEPDETKACAKNGIATSELTVATDALTVVVNKDNPVKCLTVDQLNQIWAPNSKVANWSEIKGLEPAFDEKLDLYGPGTDSGTFDYFTEAINGEEGASRTDYNNVGEDDNQTVTGVEGSPGGLGYFGYSYYLENQDNLKALEIDGGNGCVAPSAETAQKGTYTPLSRGLFIYPSKSAMEQPEVKAFLEFYLDNVGDVAEQAGFIPLTPEQLAESKNELATLESGSTK